jgi:hypothetical protein
VIPQSFKETPKPSGTSGVTVNVDFTDVITPVSKYLFGNNANVYMTQMVDQPQLIDHLKKLSPNVLRFPGGNLSSVYFWNADKNIPPADVPAKLMDANGTESTAGYWYGKNTEGWTLSVDNYYQMLGQTGSAGIITINYGYARYSTAAHPVAAAAHLAAEWVRYDNGRTKFWEIGNESNGSWQAGHRINTTNNKDGQPSIINGALYGKHFKIFADSMRKAASEKGATIYIGAQLLQEEPASWWNDTDRTWNSGVFQQAMNTPDFYIIHSYYTPYQANSNASDILNSATGVTRAMMDFVSSAIEKAGVSEKPIALTEWNIFAEGSKQQASYINGMHATLVLGELIKNKYGLACRWDLANGWNNGNDHGMFSQGDEPGVPKWHPRAAYYYMYYFQKYLGDHLVNASVSGNTNVVAYASSFESGQSSLVIVNKGTTEQSVEIKIQNYGFGDRYYYHTITGGTDNVEFSLKAIVNGQAPSLPSGGPPDFETIKPRSSSIAGGIKLAAPARSVTYMLVENGDHVITSIESQPQAAISVYPNPLHDHFEIELPSSGFSRIQIIDGNGRKVYESVIRSSEHTLEIKAALARGLYSVLLYKDKVVIHKKIIVHKN